MNVSSVEKSLCKETHWRVVLENTSLQGMLKKIVPEIIKNSNLDDLLIQFNEMLDRKIPQILESISNGENPNVDDIFRFYLLKLLISSSAESLLRIENISTIFNKKIKKELYSIPRLLNKLHISSELPFPLTDLIPYEHQKWVRRYNTLVELYSLPSAYLKILKEIREYANEKIEKINIVERMIRIVAKNPKYQLSWLRRYYKYIYPFFIIDEVLQNTIGNYITKHNLVEVLVKKVRSYKIKVLSYLFKQN